MFTKPNRLYLNVFIDVCFLINAKIKADTKLTVAMWCQILIGSL